MRAIHVVQYALIKVQVTLINVLLGKEDPGLIIILTSSIIMEHGAVPLMKWLGLLLINSAREVVQLITTAIEQVESRIGMVPTGL